MVCTIPKEKSLLYLAVPPDEYTHPLTSIHCTDGFVELLSSIFEMVTGPERSDKFRFNDFPGLPERDIMNLRLTCRRVHDCSSHLLLRHISVALNMKSLSHLEEVALHPTIRRGIHGVQFQMCFYSSVMANDIHKYAEHKVEYLHGQLGYFRRMPGAYRYRHVNLQIIQDSIRIVSSIVKCWENFAAGRSTNDEAGLILLRKCYADYQNLFTVQEEMRRNGSYTRLITSAISRLPNAKFFRVCDKDLDPDYKGFFRPTDTYKDSIQTLNTPNWWQESISSKLGDPPSEFLLQLPGMLAGVTELSLDYTIVWEHFPSIPAPSAEIFKSIENGAKHLKELQYVGNSHQNSSNDPLPDKIEAAYALKRLLSSLLGSGVIEEMYIGFGFLFNDNRLPRTTTLYPYLFPRNFPNLRILSLSSFTMHLTELEEMLGPSNPSLVSVSMRSPYLLSGTWREGLKILREPSLKDVHLNSPAGAECIEMSEEKYKAIFMCPFREMHSLAEDYMLGAIRFNPFEFVSPR